MSEINPEHRSKQFLHIAVLGRRTLTDSLSARLPSRGLRDRWCSWQKVSFLVFPISLPERSFPMQKQNLTQASRELFRRAADERFASLNDLWRHCQDFKERSTDRWHSPAEILTARMSSRLDLKLGGDGESYTLLTLYIRASKYAEWHEARADATRLSRIGRLRTRLLPCDRLRVVHRRFTGGHFR